MRLTNFEALKHPQAHHCKVNEMIMTKEQGYWHLPKQISAAGVLSELDTVRSQTHLSDRIDLLDWLPASGQGNLRSIFLGLRVDDETDQLKDVTP
jgi:hypothetical protein